MDRTGSRKWEQINGRCTRIQNTYANLTRNVAGNHMILLTSQTLTTDSLQGRKGQNKDYIPSDLRFKICSFYFQQFIIKLFIIFL